MAGVIGVRTNEFHPEITSLKDGNNSIYYHGYWINKHWFTQYLEENRAELAFPALTDRQNIQYAEEINRSLSVGIHIRRGDFVTGGWALPPSYYQSSCKAAVDAYPEASFFVFTDNVDWCRKNEDALGLNLASRTIYVTGNNHGKNYIDAQLLSMCRGIIVSNSSFCYFATLMDKNLELGVNPGKREV